MGKYQSVTRDSKGNAIGEATVTVSNISGGFVFIYSDYDLQTTKSNPFTSDADGSFEFFAPTGFYKVVVTKTGFTTSTENHIEIIGYSDTGAAEQDLIIKPSVDAAIVTIQGGDESGGTDAGKVVIKGGDGTSGSADGDVEITTSAGDVVITSKNIVLASVATDGNGIRLGSTTGPSILYGTGSPEGVYTGAVSSTFHRTDGGASTSYYVKESGSGNTGWVAK